MNKSTESLRNRVNLGGRAATRATDGLVGLGLPCPRSVLVDSNGRNVQRRFAEVESISGQYGNGQASSLLQECGTLSRAIAHHQEVYGASCDT